MLGPRRRAARVQLVGRAAAHAADERFGTDTQLETAFARVEDLQQRVADWIEPFNNAIDYTERVAALDAFYRSNDLRAEIGRSRQLTEDCHPHPGHGLHLA